MPLHSVIKSLNTTASTVSEQAWFKPQHAVAMFISLRGRDPGPATAPHVRASNNMLFHMPCPMDMLGAAPTPRQSCLPMSSPTHGSVMLQAQTHNYTTAKPTVMELQHSTDPPWHIQCRHFPSPLNLLNLQPRNSCPQMCFPRCISQEACSLSKQKVTPPAHLNQPYSLPCASPSSVSTPLCKHEITDFTCDFRLVFFLSPKLDPVLGGTSLPVKFTGCLLHDALIVWHPPTLFHFKTALRLLANFVDFKLINELMCKTFVPTGEN